MDGGTTITITGQNLGVTSADIESVIIGKSVPCTVREYKAGRRYIYTTYCVHGIHIGIFTQHIVFMEDFNYLNTQKLVFKQIFLHGMMSSGMQVNSFFVQSTASYIVIIFSIMFILLTMFFLPAL